MKRLLALCLILVLELTPLTAWAAPAWPSGVSIEADGGILMDADTGTVLYGKNMNQSYYPASITKILTALLAIENCDLDEIVTFSYDAVYNVEEGSSNAGLDEGDQLTVRDCLYALLLASANESANALAEHVSGSREEFANLMNQRAAQLGCTGSHFTNPSGLNDENHYTTAYDMALITQAAIKNPVFLEICSSRSYRLPNTRNFSVEEFPTGHLITNHHKMWNPNDASYYSGAFCGKTGYTSLAGNTLVTCARRDDMTLIAVVLNGHMSHYTDTRALFNLGFNDFQSLRITDFETHYTSVSNDMTISGMTTQDSVSLKLDENCRIILPAQADFSDAQASLSYELDSDAPAGAVAQVNYTYNERPVGRAYLQMISAAAAPETMPAAAFPETAAAETASPEMESLSDAASETVETQMAPATPALPERISDGSATNMQLPTGFWPMIGILLSLAAIVTVVIAVRTFVYRHRETQMLMRSKKDIDRIKNKDYSASEFDRLMDQYTTSSTAYSSPAPKKRVRRRPGLFGRKRRR